MKEMTFTKGKFNIEDGKVYEGFTAGHTWNGWQCPYFTDKVVSQMIEDMQQHESVEFYYNEKFDKYAVSFEEDDSNFETYSGMMIDYNGEKIKVYPIGNGSWCWDVIDSDYLKSLKELERATSNKLEQIVDESQQGIPTDEISDHTVTVIIDGKRICIESASFIDGLQNLAYDLIRQMTK